MALRSVVRKPNGKVVSLALLGGVAFASGGTVPTAAHAQSVHSWLTFDRPLLCRITVGPNTVARRCTTRWYLDSQGNIISDDPNWVGIFSVEPPGAPLTGPHASYGPLAARARAAAIPATKPAPRRQTKPIYKPVIPAAPAGIGLWTPPPGHPAYALPDFPNDPNAAYYGTCTWYAEYRRQDEPLARLGNAAEWAWNAPHYGLRVGTSPVVGATVVFQPGVLGAGSGGHVGHVEAVYGGGWFLISEMNMDWNGGGFGRVSYRYVVVMPGVSFVY